MTTYSYDRRSGSGSDWVTDEVLDQRSPSGETYRKLIEDFLEELTLNGQKLHKTLNSGVENARASIQGGRGATDRDVLDAVQRVVSHRFGDDPLAKAVALAIATGRGFF